MYRTRSVYEAASRNKQTDKAEKERTAFKNDGPTSFIIAQLSQEIILQFVFKLRTLVISQALYRRRNKLDIFYTNK